MFIEYILANLFQYKYKKEAKHIDTKVRLSSFGKYLCTTWSSIWPEVSGNKINGMSVFPITGFLLY